MESDNNVSEPWVAGFLDVDPQNGVDLDSSGQRVIAGVTTRGLRWLCNANFSPNSVDKIVKRVLKELRREYIKGFSGVYDASPLDSIGRTKQGIYLAGIDAPNYFDGQIKYIHPFKSVPAYIFAALEFERMVDEREVERLHSALHRGFGERGYFRDVLPRFPEGEL